MSARPGITGPGQGQVSETPLQGQGAMALQSPGSINLVPWPIESVAGEGSVRDPHGVNVNVVPSLS